jgi:YHS domain-containing protein
MFAYLFRLLLFFVTITVVRSVIATVVRAFRGTNVPPHAGSQGPPQRTGAQAGNGTVSESASASTLLHQDPVCGTYVAAGSSYHKIVKGQVFHFCSEACRDRYQA